jgi:hypothetical protein
MTVREEVFSYLQHWTAKRMHPSLKIEGNPEEHDACYLVNGFDGKKDVIQNATNDIYHSTMMDIHYGGAIKNEFRHSTFEIYFNAREPDYTDAQQLAGALDRAQMMADGFIRDAVKAHKAAKKSGTRTLPFWFEVENIQWDTSGPFGDGWESVVLYLEVCMPFDYCE